MYNIKILKAVIPFLIIGIVASFSLIGCKGEAAEEEVTEEVEEAAEEEVTEEVEEAEEEVSAEEEAVEEESGKLTVTTEDITINMWVLTGVVAQWFTDLTNKYMEEHPNVTFNLNQLDSTVLSDFASSALASGEEEVDFLWFWASAVGHEMAKNGLLLNLTPYFETYGWRDQQYSKIKESVETEGYGDFFFVTDFVIFPFCYYNKDIFAEVGVEPPATMDDIFTMSEKIKAAGYETWALGNKGQPAMGEHVATTIMVRFLSEEEYDMLINWNVGNNIEIFKNQNLIDAYAFLQKMVTEGVFIDAVSSIDHGEARLLFNEGKAAIWSSGSWGIGMLRPEAPDMNLGYFSLPEHTGTNRILTFYQNAVCIPSTTTSEDKLGVILDFMDSMLKKEYAITSFDSGCISSSLNITEEDITAVADPLLAAEIAETQRKGDVIDYGSKWDPVLYQARLDASAAIIAGTMTPEEVSEFLYNTAAEILAGE